MSQFIAAPFTPFDSRGDLALDVVEQQAEHLIRTGIVGAFVCGTTGESASLTLQERMDLAQRWVEVAGADLRVFVHTGHNALREAQALGRHAAGSGAYATAALPPTYFKPDSLSTLVDCCAELASSAPGLPFFYYHIPVLSGINFSAAAFVEAAADRIGNLAGIKFTHGDLPDFQHASDLGGARLQVLFGRDEMLLPALASGATGFVGSTYNYNACLALRADEAFAAGRLDDARQAQALINRYIRTMVRFGGLPAGKVMMRFAGVDCGQARLPLHRLTDEQVQQLRSTLEQEGFFDLPQTLSEPAAPPQPQRLEQAT